MTEPRRPLRPLSWWWVLLGTLAVTAAISVSMWALLAQTHGLHGPAEAQARIEAIKTALTVGAGTGGAVALLLALRRQWLSEVEQIHREGVDTEAGHDAVERRITELYTAAAAQLGAATAPVRLAGLYALERLAHDHPAHRQTIVNVICAYLRMPFPTTAPAPTPEPELAQLPPHDRAARAAADAAAAADWKQERVVRLTAQRILASHLPIDFSQWRATEWPLQENPTGPKFWPDIELDLTEAVLFDFQFTGRVKLADFSGARFVGGASFAHAEFTEHAHFHSARFEGGAGNFFGAWFGGLGVDFPNTDFGDHQANFGGATFAGGAFFGDATFGGGVSFDAARALTNTSRARRWPPGWRERPLADGERMPRPQVGRWAVAREGPPGVPAWNLIVRDDGTPTGG